MTVMAASVGWVARDRAVRRATAEGQARALLNAARALSAENKLAPARAGLAQARALLAQRGPALGDLAAEVEADEASLEHFQQFLDLTDQAHQAETAPLPDPESAAAARVGERRAAAAVPLLLEALRHYDALGGDGWSSAVA